MTLLAELHTFFRLFVTCTAKVLRILLYIAVVAGALVCLGYVTYFVPMKMQYGLVAMTVFLFLAAVLSCLQKNITVEVVQTLRPTLRRAVFAAPVILFALSFYINVKLLFSILQSNFLSDQFTLQMAKCMVLLVGLGLHCGVVVLEMSLRKWDNSLFAR